MRLKEEEKGNREQSDIRLMRDDIITSTSVINHDNENTENKNLLY